MSSLKIIVAIDTRGGIGINNKLPWHLPEDLAHFKQITSGHPIIMGRKTFDSIGRALPNRRNIVISRNREWQHAGVECVASLEAARAAVAAQDAYIIGGAEIYKQALPLADELIITEIVEDFSCDAFFPSVLPQEWQEIARESHYSEVKQLHYAFVTYKRK